MHFLKIPLICILLLMTACAQRSPSSEIAVAEHADGLSAQTIFERTFERHGGAHLSALTDVNVAVDGEWHYLITKIQPEVTDQGYRQQSQERILMQPRVYAAFYNGDAGTKSVLRTEQSLDLAYNGKPSSDIRKQQATALTADAFYLFVLGPLALQKRVENWQRLQDGNWEGKAFYRINGQLRPGLGFSESDFITLWIDKQSNLTFRLHITLQGFESTQGAHVDTSYLAYTEIGAFTFATHFFERVLGPIKIDAHEWWYTGIDINRGLKANELGINAWSEKAARPAAKLE